MPKRTQMDLWCTCTHYYYRKGNKTCVDYICAYIYVPRRASGRVCFISFVSARPFPPFLHRDCNQNSLCLSSHPIWWRRRTERVTQYYYLTSPRSVTVMTTTAVILWLWCMFFFKFSSFQFIIDIYVDNEHINW